MDIEEYLTRIDKKLDRVFNMQTKIAKALHLVPVTKKEEKSMQIAQSKNAQIALEVAEELAAMQSVTEINPDTDLNLEQLYADDHEIYSDVIGDDFLGGK